MSASVPMPRDLSEEAVAEWLLTINNGSVVRGAARAVRALLREKVREAVVLAQCGLDDEGRAIVARVMGEEAPRG